MLPIVRMMQPVFCGTSPTHEKKCGVAPEHNVPSPSGYASQPMIDVRVPPVAWLPPISRDPPDEWPPVLVPCAVPPVVVAAPPLLELPPRALVPPAFGWFDSLPEQAETAMANDKTRPEFNAIQEPTFLRYQGSALVDGCHELGGTSVASGATTPAALHGSKVSPWFRPRSQDAVDELPGS